jgi:hypothetical protein
MMKLIAVIMMAGLAHGQYAPSASGSTTAAAEINAKTTTQAGTGVKSGACTFVSGSIKDMYVDTATGAIQACTATNIWGAATLISGGAASVSSMTHIWALRLDRLRDAVVACGTRTQDWD